VAALRLLHLDLDGALFQGMTYGQRGEIQTWARALAQLHTREDGVWRAVETPPEGVEPQAAPLFLLDILAPIAALEREAWIGDVVALRDALAAVNTHVRLPELAARTDAERAEARAWLDRFAPAFAAFQADPSDANDDVVGDLEDEIPAWLSAIEYEADDEADDEAGETAEADDWTAAPGELRTVATEG
jgi:hypothetical protein